MMLFEDRTFNGPLKKYLEECKIHRKESIYNKEYRYIKEIIWDDELQAKFGKTREGYDKYKNDYSIKGHVAYGGFNDLREITDDNKIIGYLLETKKSNNESYTELIKILNNAKQATINLLNIKDLVAFDYYLDTRGFNYYNSTNELIGKIEKLEEIIDDYNNEEDFKLYLDKIIK